MLKLLEFNSNPFLGVMGLATERFALVPRGLPEETVKEVEKALDVPAIEMHVGGSILLGSLIASNSKGAVVSYIIEEDELKELEKYVDVLVLEDKHNAAGNNILVNDNFALIHPNISARWVRKIEDVLGVPAKKGTVADIPTVGSAAAVTDKGGLAHPEADDGELEYLKDLFEVPFYRGTANYGSGFVGACMIANSKGAVVGNTTTNVEISRIEDAFDLL